MKKLTLCIMTALLLLAFVPMQLNAEPETNASPKATTEVVMSDEAVVLMDRLEEIEAMDKSDLSSAERKELRKEVRDIKKELKELSGGVYISVGAAILIVLLLILLL
jgi:Ribonuclease G/E